MSASTISSLDILLKGDTRNLDGALDRAGAGVSNFRNRINGQAAQINKSLSSIGSGVGNTVTNALQNPIGAIGQLGRVLLTSLANPIASATKLIQGLASTFRNVGDSILATLKTPLLFPIQVVLKGLELAWSTLLALVKIPYMIVVGVSIVGLALVKGLLTSLQVPYRILVNLGLVGFNVVKVLLAGLVKVIQIPLMLLGLPAVQAALATIGTMALGLLAPFLTLRSAVFAIGVDLVKGLMMSIPVLAFLGASFIQSWSPIIAMIGETFNRIVIFGSRLASYFAPQLLYIKNLFAGLFTGIKDFIVRISVQGWSFITSLLSIAKTIVVNFVLQGVAMARAAIVGLYSLVKPVVMWIVTKVANLGSMISSLGSWIASAASAIGLTGLLSTAIGGLAVMAVAGGASLMALAGGAIYLANQQAKVIGQTERLAQVLNMSTSAFSSLQAVSGMDLESFAGGVEHLQRSLSEAALTGGATAAALARVGLDARTLAGSLPEAQIRSLSVAFASMTNQADRLALAQELVGRGNAADFTRMLQGGIAGLDALAAKSEKFGLIFTQQQAEVVLASNKKWNEWYLAIEGIGRNLAIAFAPIWHDIGQVLSDFFVSILRWVQEATPAIAKMWDAFKSVGASLMPILAPLYQLFAGIMRYVLLLDVLDAIIRNIDMIGPITKATAAVCGEAFTMLMQMGKMCWDGIMQSWQLVVTLWNTTLSYLTLVFGDFFAMFGVNLNTNSQQLRANTQTWQQWYQSVMEKLVMIEFTMKHWQIAMYLRFQELKLVALEWLQSLLKMLEPIKGFVNIVISMINTMLQAALAGFVATLNAMVSAYNAMARRLGRATIDLQFEVPQIPQYDQLMRQITRQIRDLRNEIDAGWDTLGQAALMNLQRRLRELQAWQTQVQTQVERQQPTMREQDFKGGAAAQKGSVEAFSIIVGDKEDHMYVALNAIVQEMREAVDLNRQQLRELQQRALVNIARL